MFNRKNSFHPGPFSASYVSLPECIIAWLFSSNDLSRLLWLQVNFDDMAPGISDTAVSSIIIECLWKWLQLSKVVKKRRCVVHSTKGGKNRHDGRGVDEQRSSLFLVKQRKHRVTFCLVCLKASSYSWRRDADAWHSFTFYICYILLPKMFVFYSKVAYWHTYWIMYDCSSCSLFLSC